MIKKKLVTLTPEQMQDMVNFHKETMESFGKIASKYNDATNFEIFVVSIGITISTALTSLGLKEIDAPLEGMFDMIKKLHEDIKKNSMYMIYKKGEKVSEGRFN